VQHTPAGAANHAVSVSSRSQFGVGQAKHVVAHRRRCGQSRATSLKESVLSGGAGMELASSIAPPGIGDGDATLAVPHERYSTMPTASTYTQGRPARGRSQRLIAACESDSTLLPHWTRSLRNTTKGGTCNPSPTPPRASHWMDGRLAHHRQGHQMKGMPVGVWRFGVWRAGHGIPFHKCP